MNNCMPGLVLVMQEDIPVKKLSLCVVVAGLLLMLGGCMSTLTGDSYSRDEARRPQTVQFGMVEYVRPVVIEGTKTGIGAGRVRVVGGIGGSTVGGGRGQAVATVLGAVAGGVAGGMAEEAATKKQGVEITVRLDSGQIVAIVQQASATTFNVGDRVRVLTLNGETRVAQ
jgi:outer membrane lipoprotein SlyB